MRQRQYANVMATQDTNAANYVLRDLVTAYPEYSFEMQDCVGTWNIWLTTEMGLQRTNDVRNYADKSLDYFCLRLGNGQSITA